MPGDVLVGAAASGQVRDVRRTAGLVAASSCLYLAGMALNDYADREVDAVERPGRPIPSGRVSPGFALGLAGALTAGAGRAGGGRRRAARAGRRRAAGRRGLGLRPGAEVDAGALGQHVGLPRAGRDDGRGRARRRARCPPAAVVAAHIAVVTEVSRREVTGGDAVGRPSARWPRPSASPARARCSPSRAAPGAPPRSAWSARTPRSSAARTPTPRATRRRRACSAPSARGSSGLMPLEAGLLAGAGALVPAAGVAALWPLARRAAKRERAVT